MIYESYGEKKKQDIRQGNKYAHLSGPEVTFDFHGEGIMTADEIRNRAEHFLKECRSKGCKNVLIITGKGLHSANGPVIGPLLREYLPRLNIVQSVQTARRDRGGEGALEIELR